MIQVRLLKDQIETPILILPDFEALLSEDPLPLPPHAASPTTIVAAIVAAVTFLKLFSYLLLHLRFLDDLIILFESVLFKKIQESFCSKLYFKRVFYPPKM